MPVTGLTRRVFCRRTVSLPPVTLSAPEALLAVDLGVRTGLALYRRDGRLVWYRSANFGSAARLKKAIPALLVPNPFTVIHLVIEGGGPLAELWTHAAERRYIDCHRIDALTWRRQLLLPREHRDRTRLKLIAERLARQVIVWSEAPRPTSLRHDAAEAILIGLWGVRQVGWLDILPVGGQGSRVRSVR